MNDIIVGIDRSETAHRAAITAAELAAAHRTNLHLVMCIDRTKPVNMTVGGDVFHTDSVSDAEQFLASVASGLPHDSITHAVGFSSPAKMLCEEAERLDARTIVVGNRRVQGMSRVLGSVASDVTRQAPCSVLIANTFND
jgi:nucleotide-binding universal stress UspA family protein